MITKLADDLTPVMSPESTEWDEFIERLSGPEGCNFRKEDGETVWNCNDDLSKSRAILEAMGYDVETSLNRLTELGGHCDCEVIFNADR